MILSYTAYDYSNGLNVLAKIYNVTSGSAVFVQNLVLTPLGFGGTYFKLAPVPPSGSSYVANIAVYTDGTYSLLNPNYTPADAEIENVNSGGGIIPGSCPVVGYVIPSPTVVGYVVC